MEIFKHVTANGILLENFPFMTEIAMEAYLMENEEILKLEKKGKTDFTEVAVLDAEIPLEGARNNRDGRIDLLVNYSDEFLGIVELKKTEINTDSLKQLKDYLKKREDILKISDEYWQPDGKSPKWIGVLVGTEISSELKDMLLAAHCYKDEPTTDNPNPVEIPIAGITIQRFRNKNTNEIYVISDTYFKMKKDKDYTKYNFNNDTYNKGRLVNAVIQKIVDDNPKITFSELKQKFPDDIQGSNGVFKRKEEAKSINAQSGTRYLTKDEKKEPITLSDGTVICTCNQWKPENIKRFIKQANEKFGSKIVEEKD